MRQVGRTTLVDSAIRELREEISSGVWPVGTKIPSESQLAEMLGVSRLSVREAVRVLVHAGLLTTRQGDGTYVTATDESEVALKRRLDRAATMDIIDVRRGLDLVAARLAAERRTPEDLDALRETLERRTTAHQAIDLDAFADADLGFHLSIAAASHNPVLLDLYRGMSEAVRDTLLRDHCMERAVLSSDSSHQELYEAIEAGDAAGAVKIALAILDEQERDL
ncbi:MULTISPECIES: FadR/GntR family transcriptional regulator [Streptosporangium]|uniref:DNA-binding FadR family transcriptional regulator n=1 Tax=Streptosporangium brasiliense TaxID=47480 RepID=A0ABT9RJI2_9ACTN|nr:FadR/GntR family transcriptional regulator [Streptosporangium brasiliense]MDP9868495.1 DNA-binding FadR family transcriptional regulator [Streptosporangium brasiliense]